MRSGTLTRALFMLEAFGFIHIEEHGGLEHRPNLYHLIYSPAGFVDININYRYTVIGDVAVGSRVSAVIGVRKSGHTKDAEGHHEYDGQNYRAAS